MNKKVLVGAAVAVVLVIAGVLSWQYRQTQSSEVQSQSHLLVRDSAMSLGEPSAKVVVVEFFDPECESCRRFHPLTKMLLEEFKGQIKLVLRYAPFHQNSKYAVQILEAARKQNLYWDVLDKLYQYQPQWGDHHHPRPELIWNYLPEVAGLDVEKLKAEMNDPATDKIIEQDLSDGQKLGVQRTPSFFVNGEPLLTFGYQELRELVLKHTGL
jgi:protein-disulfide isomerase